MPIDPSRIMIDYQTKTNLLLLNSASVRHPFVNASPGIRTHGRREPFPATPDEGYAVSRTDDAEELILAGLTRFPKIKKS
jgi:hypothetical protein